MRVHIPCLGDPSRLPMDVQECSLDYESYAYNRDAVKLQWMGENPVVMLKGHFSIQDFILASVKHEIKEPVRCDVSEK